MKQKKFTKKYWFNFPALAFFAWLAVVFIVLCVAVVLLEPQTNFLGGGLQNYSNNPVLFAFGNFDGEHYVSISQNGYGYGERAFFPLYPGILNFATKIFGLNTSGTYFAGIAVSLVAFYFALQGLYKLVKLDYSEKTARLALTFLLLFPTSFYFAAVYTESLFLFFLVWSVYFLRTGKVLLALVFGTLLTATRFVGILIVPVFLVELLLKDGKVFAKHIPVLAVLPAGLVSYMIYLKKTVNDYFAFYTSLSTFGEQRSGHPIVLPQVFYRYVFKILPGMHTNFFPVLFTTWLEFLVGVIYLPISLLLFVKTRLSYAILVFFGYIVPTMSGSFSSLPRYVLVLFPVYIVFADYMVNRKKVSFAFSLISFILLVISFALFSRGYWVS